MTDKHKRGRGRPSKDGEPSSKWLLSKVMKEADPAVLNRIREVMGYGCTNELVGDHDESLANDRSNFIKSPTVRNARIATTTETTRSKLERQKQLAVYCAQWPNKTASDIAGTLHGKGLFTDISLRTLRGQIGEVRKLADPN